MSFARENYRFQATKNLQGPVTRESSEFLTKYINGYGIESGILNIMYEYEYDDYDEYHLDEYGDEIDESSFWTTRRIVYITIALLIILVFLVYTLYPTLIYLFRDPANIPVPTPEPMNIA